MKNKILFTLVATFCLVFIDFTPAHSLSVTLKRIVFEGSKRSEVLTIINNTDNPQTYRIGWLYYVMNDQGRLVAVERENLPPEVRPAEDMIRYAPRRITVPAKKSQQIRVMMRMPAGVEDGEYRSHLWIRVEPNVERIKKTADEERRKSGVNKSLSLEMLPGITMPVIIRKGDVNATINIQNLQAQQSPGFVNISYDFLREGMRSVYGDTDYICNAGTSSAYLLKRVRGIGVYNEINLRKYNLKTEKPTESSGCNTLTVSFQETEDSVRSEKALSIEATTSVGSL